MPAGQVTLGSGATQLISGPTRGMNLLIQNNSAHACRVADSAKVSITTPAAVNGGTAGFGILLQPGGAEGGSFATSGAFNLNKWYIAGTLGDAIDYQYTVEE